MARQPGNFPVLQPLAVHSSLSLSDLSLNPSLSFFCLFSLIVFCFDSVIVFVGVMMILVGTEIW